MTWDVASFSPPLGPPQLWGGGRKGSMIPPRPGLGEGVRGRGPLPDDDLQSVLATRLNRGRRMEELKSRLNELDQRIHHIQVRL
jgi:hypothetical protein